MPLVNRTVRGNHVIPALWSDAFCNKSACARNKTIYYNRNPSCSTTQYYASYATNFKTPNFSQYVKTIPALRFVYLNYPPDYINFSFKPFLVNASSITGNNLSINSAHAGSYCAARSSIAYSHISSSNNSISFFYHLPGNINSNF